MIETSPVRQANGGIPVRGIHSPGIRHLGDNDMKHFAIKRQGVGWLVATALCLTALIVPGTDAARPGLKSRRPAAPPTIPTNWEDQFEHPAMC